MKVTDAFTLYHKGHEYPPSVKGYGVKPVSVIDKMSLQPGQLFRGEVLGEDGKGHLLLKIGGEIIATRGLVSMATGQQVWVEVKEVGDSPLFALAQAKGAVHELLKNIMEVRPAVLVQGKSEAVVPPDFQASPEQSAEVSFVPKLAPLHPDGGLPRETTQLFKALLALPKAELPSLSDTKMQQLAPFLSEATGKIDVGQVASVLSQTGKVPPVLGEIAPLRPLFVFGGSGDQVSPGSLKMAELPQPQGAVASVGAGGSAPATAVGQKGMPPVPFITTDGQVVAHTVQVVRSLVASVPLLLNASGENEQQSMEQLTKGFTELLKFILAEGKVTENLRRFEPVRQLFQASLPVSVKGGPLLQPLTSDELIQGFAQTVIKGNPLSPAHHNETVAKVLSGLQGTEPKPELLRVLKQLVSASQSVARLDDAEAGGGDKQTAKLGEAAVGLAKAASFFQAQAQVNQEVSQVAQGDCVLVPCFFAGQSGWGEWMWSHEQTKGKEQTQENLAFFLEMSNLGPVSIQAILGEKSLSGQFRVADDRAYNLIVQGLPVLEERLNALGYEAHLTCRQKPVAVMQEIKDSLESRTSGGVPSSLVDIQA